MPAQILLYPIIEDQQIIGLMPRTRLATTNDLNTLELQPLVDQLKVGLLTQITLLIETPSLPMGTTSRCVLSITRTDTTFLLSNGTNVVNQTLKIL